MRTILRVLLVACIAISCRKGPDLLHEIQIENKSQLQSCDFGLDQFNTIKRAFVQEEIMAPDVPEAGSQEAVLLIDFNGHTVSGTMWNTNGNIICSPANLTQQDMTEVIKRVSEDFSPFEIKVTTNEDLYNQCNPARRMRVIVTESWEWYGQAGGVSYLGSFTWGNNTPCFVFSLLLNYNIKRISEAVSHEAGHTLGLYHQSLFDNLCGFLAEYHHGTGIGEISWAPIMGNSYYRNLTTWHRGTSINGCNNLQDDVNIIRQILSIKDDDHPHQFNRATVLNSEVMGAINSSTDVDMFVIDRASPSSIQVQPFNVGLNNEGANVDLLVKIYSQSRLLISTINDPLILSASVTLPAERYFISVESVANINTSRYGQLGNYSVTLN